MPDPLHDAVAAANAILVMCDGVRHTQLLRDTKRVANIIAYLCIVPREAKLRRAVDGLKGAALALKSSGMTSTAKAIETIVAEIEGRS